MGLGGKARKRRVTTDDGGGPAQQAGTEPFRLSTPRGWQASGGLIGRNSTALAGPAHILSGKLDLAVTSDRRGTVQLQWVPELGLLQGTRSLPPQPATAFPTVTAVQFIQQILFPMVRPKSEGTAFTVSRALPQVAQPYQQRVLRLQTGQTVLYDGGLCSVTYREDGMAFEERLFTLIVIQASHTGLRGNRETVMIRAPLLEFHQWLPVLREMHQSFEINGAWVKEELVAQMKAGLPRAGDTNNMETLTARLMAHQAETQAEIHRHLFL